MSPAPGQLAEVAVARALVGLHRNEDVALRVLEVLALGRRLARCERGSPLLSFAVGRRIEDQAGRFASRAAERSLWSPAALARISSALGAPDALGVKDLQRAIDGMLEETIELLPPAVENERVYSRPATERRLREELARLRATVGAKNPDFTAQRADLTRIVSEEERAMLRAVQGGITSLSTWIEVLVKRRPPPADNLAGRLAVQMLVLPYMEHIERLREGLAVARARARELAVVRPGKAKPRVRPAGKPVGVGMGSGRCERMQDGVYRLDPVAAKALRERGESAVSETARVVPAFADGGVIGFKVFAFNAGSFPAS